MQTIFTFILLRPLLCSGLFTCASALYKLASAVLLLVSLWMPVSGTQVQMGKILLYLFSVLSSRKKLQHERIIGCVVLI